jgi:hypothetical protein
MYERHQACHPIGQLCSIVIVLTLQYKRCQLVTPLIQWARPKMERADKIHQE